MQSSRSKKESGTFSLAKPMQLSPPYHDVSLIAGVYCHLLRLYQPTCSILISRQKGKVGVVMAGTDAKQVDPGSLPEGEQLLVEFFPKLCNLLAAIHLDQAQFYFGGPELTLTDVRVSANKFAGPGMLTDVFGRVVPTPTQLVVETIDERAAAAITAGSGTYAGNLSIRPSRNRVDETGRLMRVEVTRCA